MIKSIGQEMASIKRLQKSFIILGNAFNKVEYSLKQKALIRRKYIEMGKEYLDKASYFHHKEEGETV